MLKPRIVLIEDEDDIATIIKLQANSSGYDISVASDGLNGYDLIRKKAPDLIILDIMLPGENGLEVCKKVKSNLELRHVPILMISAKSEESDIILGLELGADDYITKPFSPRVLFSRVKAVLRRNQEEEQRPSVIKFGHFRIEVDKYLVEKRGEIVPLTLSEFGIFKRLLLSCGKVLTRNQLLDALQTDDEFVIDRNIDVHIASLRKKLGPNFDYIQTVRGVGYRFRSLE
jgi:two-component system alkaline phosphatase synthesis response regulator PhoP